MTEPRVEWHGADWEPRADRSLWWPAQSTLLVADLHLGKDATFRARGMPVPVGGDARTLERLRDAVVGTSAARLVILGDLFHGREARGGAASDFAAWCAASPTPEVRWIRGNHDRWIPDPGAGVPAGSAADEVAGWRLVHEPDGAAAPYVAGHLHPGVRVGAGRGRALRLPCFWFRSDGIVLPAFGAFTGTAEVDPGRDDRIFAIAGGAVVEVPAAARAVGRFRR